MMGQQPEGKTLESHLEASWGFQGGCHAANIPHASVTREAPEVINGPSMPFQHSSPWVHGLSNHRQVEISTPMKLKA